MRSARTLGLVLLILISFTSTAIPTSASSSTAVGTTVLSLKAGSGAGQVGITTAAAPTSFRVGSDGSYRIMDAVNKRILYFSSAGKLERTIGLSFLQRPVDFSITSTGTVYVLDAGAWQVARVSLAGKLLSKFNISAKLKGKFTTLSLTADNHLYGVGFNGTTELSFLLATPAQALTPVNQEPQFDAAVTVRSNAFFQTSGQDLLITYDAFQSSFAGLINFGAVQGTPKFLDVNLGMEPYMSISNQGLVEVRRYSVAGKLLGGTKFDLRPYRTALRRVYVDRPGAVYAMQIGKSGLTIGRFVVTDAAGKPVYATPRLVTTAPWSPGVVPPPGAA